MRFKPSALEFYIATLPEGLQIEALKAVKEEHDRWDRRDLTPEEYHLSVEIPTKLAINCRKTIEALYVSILNKTLTGNENAPKAF